MSERAQIQKLVEAKAYALRVNSLLMTTQAGSGHPTSCLSAADIVAALFFYAMRYDPCNFDNPNNDRFILSKGHAAPLLYAAWQQAGALSEQELLTYRQFNSVLEGHPTARFKYAEAATGSLGIGLSIGAGEALVARLDKRDFYTYVLMGDAEIAEGCIWEAAEIAAHYKLNNLIGIVDCNRLGQSTESLHDHHVQQYAQKFSAFGWHTLSIDGHDIQQIMHALDDARTIKDKPVMIIAKTFKGHGVSFLEDKSGLHGKALNQQDCERALSELKKRYVQAAEYGTTLVWHPQLPAKAITKKEHVDAPVAQPPYNIADSIATRKAYGTALAALGQYYPEIVSLDAEVKNSTYADIFEQKFPERFFQCYVAEQNMVSMGVGMRKRGKIPYISTFAAFFSRAYDQIRMAAIGRSALRLVGSHCGVSIGQDGPSQMGLEDIAFMRALPESVVLYPCDAVSTHKLVQEMAQYEQGISYLRTTRMATPVIYNQKEKFSVGGCNVLRSSNTDVACVIAAGITVHEALKAYDMLQQEGIAITVIDLYSIKPLNADTLLTHAKRAGKRIITVEDHYLQGGLGEAVTYAVRSSECAVECLAVMQLPRSGKPDELLAWAGIDAAAIVRAVKK